MPTNTPVEITIPVWVKQGMMRVRRDCLAPNDPDHTYNYVKETYGVRPEEYGINHPYEHEFGEQSREELIDEILSLRREIISYQQYGG